MTNQGFVFQACKCLCTRVYHVFCSFVYSVGRPKHVKVMAGGLEGDMFIGPQAEVGGVFILILINY